MLQMTEEQVAVIQRVEKLLRLSGSSNAAEAAQAAAKAQELLTRHNLDLAVVEMAGGGDGRREDQRQRGGMYLYQRQLWQAVAELNYCVYFTYRRRGTRKVTTKYGWQYRNTIQYERRLVGRRVNVATTQVMAGYLEQAVERLCRDRLHERYPDRPSNQYYSQWAVSFRTGAVETIVDRIYERRQQVLSEERARERELAARMSAGQSTATALTVAALEQRERDANMDFIHGEGYSARRRAREAELAEERRREQAEYVAWAAANPDAARKQEEERERRLEAELRRAARRGSGGGPERDWGAYSAGIKAGRSVSIDPQTADSRPRGSISHQPGG